MKTVPEKLAHAIGLAHGSTYHDPNIRLWSDEKIERVLSELEQDGWSQSLGKDDPISSPSVVERVAEACFVEKGWDLSAWSSFSLKVNNEYAEGFQEMAGWRMIRMLKEELRYRELEIIGLGSEMDDGW